MRNTKKILSLFLVLAMLCGMLVMPAAAEGTEDESDALSGSCGTGVTYELSQNSDGETYTLTIDGEGEMAASEWPWADYADAITEVVLEDGITKIGQNAFKGCSALAEVTLPGSLDWIGKSAFQNTALTSVEIPEGVSTIKARAFDGCADLVEVSLPSTITFLGNGVFDNCNDALVISYNGNAAGWANVDVSTTDNEALAGVICTVPTTYTVTVATGIANGTVEVDKTEAKAGDTVTVTATAAGGYELDEITVTDENDGDVTVGADGKFTMPASSVTVSATFVEETVEEPEDPTWTVANATYADGTLAVDVEFTGINVPADHNNLVFAYANCAIDGVTLGSWTITAGDHIGKTATVRNVPTVFFSTMTPEDTAKATITYTGVELDAGTYTITLAPASNNYYTGDDMDGDWALKDDAVTVKSYTLAVEPATTYTVTVDDEIENGTVEVDKTEAKAGDTVTVTATADGGYELDKITVTDENDGDVTVGADGKFTMPASSVTVSATFKSTGVAPGADLIGGETITKEGTYYLTETATGVITIATTESVTIVGNGVDATANTALSLQGAVAGIDLTINNVSATSGTVAPLIDFKGTDNKLTLAGTSMLENDGKTFDYAIIHVPKDGNLTIDGEGTLYVYKSSLAPAIGGNKAETNGEIIFNGGTVFAKGSKTGAVIGAGDGAGGGAITVNGGSLYVMGKARGACLGGSGYSGGVVGDGGGVTITGGTVMLVVDHTGASIGGGGGNNSAAEQDGGTVVITGGSLKARINSNAYSNWGVTAGSADEVYQINDITITAEKLNGSNKAVYKLELPLTGIDADDGNEDGCYTVCVDGEEFYQGDGYEYTFSASTSSTMANWPKGDPENCLYLYVTGEDHTVEVNGESINFYWDAANSTFSTEPVATYSVTVISSTYGSVDVDKYTAAAGDTVTVTATAVDNYELDEITVTDANGNSVTVDENGKFTMPAGSVTVSATFKAASSGETGIAASFELQDVTASIASYLGIPLSMGSTSGEGFSKVELDLRWNRTFDGTKECTLSFHLGSGAATDWQETPSFYTTVDGLTGAFSTATSGSGYATSTLTLEATDGTIAAGDLGKLVFSTVSRDCSANYSHKVEITAARFYDASGEEVTGTATLTDAASKVTLNKGGATDPGYSLTIPEYDEAVFSANWGTGSKKELDEYTTGKLTNVTPHYGFNNTNYNRYQYYIQSTLTGDKQIGDVGYTIDGLGVKVSILGYTGSASFNVPANDITLYATFIDGYTVSGGEMEHGKIQFSLDNETWSDSVKVGRAARVYTKVTPDDGYMAASTMYREYTLYSTGAQTKDSSSAGATISMNDIGSDVVVTASFVPGGTVYVEQVDASTGGGNTYTYKGTTTKKFSASGNSIPKGETVTFTAAAGKYDKVSKKYCSKIEYSTDNESWTELTLTYSYGDATATFEMPQGSVYLRLSYKPFPTMTVAEDLKCTVTLNTSVYTAPGDSFKASVSDIPDGYRLESLYYQDAEGNKTYLTPNVNAAFPFCDTTVYATVTNSTAVDYTISTAKELCDFAAGVKDGSIYAVGKVIKLTDDIDLTDSGYAGFDFVGLFDGNGHTISGLTAPLFNSLIGATVKDLTVDGTISNAQESYIGAVAMKAFGAVTIENCVNKAAVTGTKASAYVGGILGSVEDTAAQVTLRSCVNEGNVTGGYGAGGMLGWAWSFNTLKLENCGNSAAISATRQAGGIVGYNGESYSITGITGCYNTGAVSLTNSAWDIKAGGIMGNGKVTSIADCYNTGSVTVYSGNVNYECWGAGIYGGNTAAAISNCYNTGTIVAKGGANGTGTKAYSGDIVTGNNTTTTVTNCYNAEGLTALEDAVSVLNGENGTAWTSTTDSTYPVLAWQVKTGAGEDNKVISAASFVDGVYTISSKGEYTLAADAAGAILIATTDAVTLVGPETTNVKDNTTAFTGLSIYGTVAGIDLTIKDLFITNGANYSAVYEDTTYWNIIHVTGAGNKLTLTGTNDLECSGGAVIHVPSTAELAIGGTGTLYLYKTGAWTCIGGNGNEANGKITINGGKIFAKASKMGALIGTGASCTATPGDITINGGILNLLGNARGAVIGTGANSACGSTGKVTINGGSININVDFSGAAIGAGNNHTAESGSITIDGGSLRVFINENAVGSWSSAGVTTAGVSSVPLTHTPKNSDGATLYMITVPTDGGEDEYTVKIDGAVYYTGGLHEYCYVNEDKVKAEQVSIDGTTENWTAGTDTNLYFYLTGENHTVSVNGGEATQYYWDAETSTFTTTAPSVTYDWYETTNSAGAYEIGTAAELAQFAAIVNGTDENYEQDSFSGKTVVLTADIALDTNNKYTAVNDVKYGTSSYFVTCTQYYVNADAEIWTPIGDGTATSNTVTVGHAFAGTFDGKDHTISGLYTGNGTAATANTATVQGLFGVVTGTVKNVTVSGCVTGSTVVGGVVAYLNGGTMENCTNNAIVFGDGGTTPNGGTENGADRGGAVGGIVGLVYGTGKISGCVNNANVTCANSNRGGRVGGIIGLIDSTSVSYTIEKNANHGDITGYQYVAGIIGMNYSKTSPVDSCFNTGNMYGWTQKAHVGGIVGQYDSDITNCYNTGNVTVKNSSNQCYSGGIAGDLASYSAATGAKIENCYSTGVINGNSTGSLGTIVGDSGRGTVTNCYYVAQAGSNASVLKGTAVTADELKTNEFLGLLNPDAFNLDSANVNGGYPVLKFQGGTEYVKPHWYDDGSATEYTIETAAELTEFAQIVNGTHASIAQDTFKGKTVTLADDIDLSGIEWVAIGGAVTNVSLTINSQEELDAALEQYILIYDTDGTSYKKGAGEDKQKPWSASASYYYVSGPIFSGTFDGNDKTISGLTVNTTTGYAGLFGNVDGTLKNFTVKGSVTSTANNMDYVGGVAGKLSIGGTVTGVTSYVNVTANSCFNVGGIVGCNGSKGSFESKDNTFVTECVNYGDISAYQAVGGIAGHNAGQIQRCANYGTITATKTSSKNGIGGIVGRNGENNAVTDSGTILDCYNAGTVGTAGAKWIGGITGFNAGKSSVINCYNVGTMIKGAGQCNALVGQSEGTVTNCWCLDTTVLNDADGVYNAGGTKSNCGAKTAAEMKTGVFAAIMGSSYNCDLTGDNAINNGYPVLAWQGGTKAPTIHTVTLPKGSQADGYLTTTTDSTIVEDGGSFTFSVALIDTTKIVTVKVGDTVLTAVENKYTISNITADVTVTITVEDSKYLLLNGEFATNGNYVVTLTAGKSFDFAVMEYTLKCTYGTATLSSITSTLDEDATVNTTTGYIGLYAEEGTVSVTANTVIATWTFTGVDADGDYRFTLTAGDCATGTEDADKLPWSEGYTGEDAVAMPDPIEIGNPGESSSTGIEITIGDGTDSGTTEDGVTTVTIGSTAIKVTAPADGWAEGENTFTVSSTNDIACVVLVKKADGTYTRLTATGTTTHSFTATLAEGDSIVVAVKGDADGDGKVGATDATAINRANLDTANSRYNALDDLTALIADIDGDGKVDATDATAINRANLDTANSRYNAINW